MRKLLNILTIVAVTVTSASTVIACNKTKTADKSTVEDKIDYFDKELDQIKNKAYQ